MDRFQRTGFLPGRDTPAVFADTTNLGDLTDTMVRTAENIDTAAKQGEFDPAPEVPEKEERMPAEPEPSEPPESKPE